MREADNADLIHVAPGIYRETVSFNGKALTIASENPWDAVVGAAPDIGCDEFGTLPCSCSIRPVRAP